MSLMDNPVTSPENLGGQTVEHVAIDSLQPYENNARKHSRNQVRKLAASIKSFGFVVPILIDDANKIICGHARVCAAKRSGMTAVPALRICHLSADQVRAFVIADNRLAELADWDKERLAIEFAHLAEVNLEFGLEVTGFETPEIDLLIDSLDTKTDKPEDDVELPGADVVAIARLHDVWQLGDHRLVCGNALKRSTFMQLMDGERAQMVFTDPPYNVPINDHALGKGKTRHREFPMASGELSDAEFVLFLRKALQRPASVCRDGALIYVCMDWRHIDELLAAAQGIDSELKNLCVWVKTNGGMGSFYRSQHELVFVFKYGRAPHVNNIDLGRYGRNRTNVWSYPGVNAFGPGRTDALKLHPTVKPVAMIADAIRDASHRGDIVIDSFCGSGSTILATERTGRRCYAVELDPLYVDTAIRRWQAETGETAVLVDGDLSFAEAENIRVSRPRGSEVSQQAASDDGDSSDAS